MRFQIYQINSDRDKNHIKFMGLQDIEKFQGTAELDPGIYDRVFIDVYKRQPHLCGISLTKLLSRGKAAWI